MSQLKKTAKFAAIYAIGVLINRSISFIMLPIYTRFLTPSDYGIIELLTMTIDVVAMLIGLGVASAIIRFYYKYESQAEKNEVISTVTVLLLSFYFITSIIGFFCSKYLSFVVFSNYENTYYFQLVFITFFFQPMVEIPFIYFKARQKPGLFVIMSTGKLIIQLSLNIYFVVILKMGVLGVLYSTLAASAFVGVILIIYTLKDVGVSFSKTKAYALIAFGAPFIIANFGDFILTFSDRYFLKAFSTLEEVGIYSLGYKFGFILWIMVQRPIFNIWQPQRFEIAERKDAKEINQRTFFYFNLLLIIFALGTSLFGRDLFRIMSDQSFWGAYKIIPLIMIAYIIQAWTAFGNFGVMYKEKTKYIAIGTFAAAVSILIFSFIFIPYLKGIGAAIATILAFFVRFIIIYYYSQKEYRLYLQWGKVILMLLLASGICILSFIFLQNNIFISIVLNSILFLAFLTGILVLPIFEKGEKKIIINMIKNPMEIIKPKGINNLE